MDESGAPKRFGFCDFEDAEGLLRALRVLKEYPLAGSELALNPNQARPAGTHASELKNLSSTLYIMAALLTNTIDYTVESAVN